MKKIILNIEAIRKEKGIKQSVLAESLGITQGAYSQYIWRNQDLKYNKIVEIANILNVPVVDIITYPEKYVPISEVKKECEYCKQKDLIIENLNNYIQILKSTRKK